MKKYRIITLTLAIVILSNIVLFSSSVVFAEKPVGMNAAINDSNRIAKAVEIKNAFETCYTLSSLLTTDDESSGVSYMDPGLVAKFNNNLFYGKTTVNTTLDIERSINYADRNGKIYCSEEGVNENNEKMNLTKLFMQTFNIGSIQNLFCKSDGSSGLFTPRIKYGVNANISCREMLNSKKPEFVKNDDPGSGNNAGREYINAIYENWAKQQSSGLAPTSEDSKKGNETQTLKYAAAYKAFRMGCMESGHDDDFVEKRPNDEPPKYYDFTIKKINDDGTLVNVYPHLKSEDPNQVDHSPSGSNKSNYRQAGNNLTCKKLADIINETADEYLKNIKTAKDSVLNTPCNNKEYKAKAQEIINVYIGNQEAEKRSSSYINKALPQVAPQSNPKMQVSKEEYDTLLKAVKEDNFYVDNGNGGKKCLETANLKPCNTAELKDKARKIRDYYEDRIYNKAETLSEEENAEYKSLVKAINSDNFTVSDSNGNNKCLETANFNTNVNLEDDVEGEDSQISEETTAEKQSYCQENGGFLSWMLCPAIADGAATAGGLLGSITALTTVHTSIIEQFSKQDSSIYKAWSAFRNIANIGFVIMLLVVVFSQVTNIGISNYNIKKILPKLIITAILVNFSYLIMGVLIDLSQIAGNGIGALIRSVAADGIDADASARASATISTIAGLVTGAAGAGAIAAGLLSGPAIILPVVMFIVTSLISVFFGFIMLTIRQAAIIMVVVLAPLAMVLYALPNTAAITKKYFSTVKALLMLYPMFIFATSAGALASSIIVGTSTDMLMLIVGGLLNVLPYFAIPSMTSKSLAGLGAITGAFDKIRGGALKGASMAGGAFAASEFYKNVKSNYAADQSVARAKRDLKRFDKIKAGGGELSTAQMRRQATAAGIVNNDSKLRAGSDSAGRGALSNMSGLGFENLKATAEKEFRESEVKNIMNKLANDGVDEATMESNLISALKTGAKYEHMTEDEKHANDIKIEALTRALGATKTGRKKISEIGDSGLSTSNRAFTQLASAAVTLPGFADKQQIANRQFNEYLQNTSYKKDDDAENSSLMAATRSAGLDKAYDDMTMDNFLKVGNADAKEILDKKGKNALDSVAKQTASAALNDPNLISDFDKDKMSLVSAEMNKQRTSTINLRSGGTAQVFNPPSDFGEYSQAKNGAGDIIYTNKRGDIFNASTGDITKGV